MELLIAGLVGLAAFIFAATLLSGRGNQAVQTRLARIATIDAPTLEELELQQPIFERTLRPFFQRLSAVASRMSSPRMLDRTENLVAMAGYPGGLRAVEFLALKLLLSLGGIAIAFLLGVVIGRDLVLGLMMIGGLAGMGYLGPDMWLRSRISRRRTAILRSLPDTLDLLTISVRAGLGFDQALAKVVEKLRGPLSDELRRVLAEIRVGRQRRDALRELAARVDVQPLTMFIGAIVQAENLGVPISRVLQIQSEQMRIERRQRAEEMANKAPIKMLFPLVGCIFPAMFIVILGPAIILIIQQLTRHGL